MLSARYIKPHYSEFVEELNRLMTKSPKYTGDIFLTMIEAGHYFYFDKEKIITFITGLYENGEKESADKICNTYLLHGFDFLNDVYTANL